MTLDLRIFIGDSGRGHKSWSHMRFAVVDLDKSKSYPENFVSMLPMRIDSAGKLPSAFTKLFGDKSLETARRLLTKSLKRAHNYEIKAEIERRLTLLEPNPVIDIRCRVCKRYFKILKGKARRQKTCPECKKRFDRKK